MNNFLYPKNVINRPLWNNDDGIFQTKNNMIVERPHPFRLPYRCNIIHYQILWHPWVILVKKLSLVTFNNILRNEDKIINHYTAIELALATHLLIDN